MRAVKQLNALATEMVGDDKTPNLFFVTYEGDVVTVTRTFEIAHREWKSYMGAHKTSAVEDRRTGVICSAGMEPSYVELTDDFTGPEVWTVHDDSINFGFRGKNGGY